ncbi:voltage-dependent T-type calcium channel subunit alpha-1G [Caerostris darwini]|uniref:Voltage-dependent T-type calcium channel subunit alpha-1G n=1 Tax=Caerostris darwini TaxID=1538125 RepID=A0AAV4U3R4_9ARAC|nr:voltage-dependent T-type calcium channel subunit alpha-1G [Caerostris darwini]
MRVNIFEIKKGRVNGVVKRGMGFKGKLSALLCPGLLKIRNDEWTRRRFTKNITKTTQADKEKRLRCTKEEHLASTFECVSLEPASETFQCFFLFISLVSESSSTLQCWNLFRESHHSFRFPKRSGSQSSRIQTWTPVWFERLCMAVILLNCVTLGLYRPCADAQCATLRCRLLQHSDDLIFGFFAFEMLVKVTAMGAFGRDAYLADTWNRLDFFIVLAG